MIADDVAQGTIWLGSHGSEEAAFVKDTSSETVFLETWIKSPVSRVYGAWIDCAGLYGAYSRTSVPRTMSRGEWSYCGASVCVNGERVPPPSWKQPGMKSKSPPVKDQDVPYSSDLLEKPLVDELFTLRPPTAVRLKKGWNHVRITLPPRPSRRGATFCLVEGTSEHPREVEGLEYSSRPRRDR